MEQQLYHLSLILAGIINLVMAGAIVYNSFYYRYYRVYQRSRLLTAVSIAIFGIGFLLHHFLGWRALWPEAATALTVSYFHMGGTLLAWSHTSLLNPNYLNRRKATIDVTAVTLCLTVLWTGVTLDFRLLQELGIAIFLVHVTWMSISFLRTYYRVSHLLTEMKLGNINEFVRWMLLSCYLIIAFGLGSVVFTALLPHVVWPYTVLLCVGNVVFIYIFYSISEYGLVIESATNATEDVAISYQL